MATSVVTTQTRQVSRVNVSVRPKLFSSEEVAQHDRPEDCWVVIRGKVYDVTRWVPRHPGGSLIYVKAGRDCTQIFESHHPLAARRVLEKYYIGDLSDEGDTVEFMGKEEEEFYTALKSRVEAYFHEKKIDPRISTVMFVKTAVIMTTLLASFWGLFFYFTSPPGVILCVLLYAAALTQVGVSVQHDANHGAYSKSPVLGHGMGLVMDLVGGKSSWVWKQQHVAGHHAFTNIHGLDPDIDVSDPDIRRYHEWHRLRPWHAWQHVYLGFAYCLLALSSILMADFVVVVTGRLGPMKVARMARHELACFVFGKAAYFSLFVAAPMLAGKHSAVAALGLWSLVQLLVGVQLAMMFQLAHVVEGVEFLHQSPASGKVEVGWAEGQMRTTADFAQSSWFWTHYSGGLNHQTVHHLFPAVCHCYYQQLAPIVKATAEEFGIPYHIYPTFASALRSHFRHLRKMGVQGLLTAH